MMSVIHLSFNGQTPQRSGLRMHMISWTTGGSGKRLDLLRLFGIHHVTFLPMLSGPLGLSGTQSVRGAMATLPQDPMKTLPRSWMQSVSRMRSPDPLHLHLFPHYQLKEHRVQLSHVSPGTYLLPSGGPLWTIPVSLVRYSCIGVSVDATYSLFNSWAEL